MSETVSLTAAQSVAVTAEKKRVWELDFLRGVLILLVIFDHFLSVTSEVFGGQDYGALTAFARAYVVLPARWVVIDFVRILFVLAAGVSTQFSRNNFRRGLEVLGVAGIMTGGTAMLKYTGVTPDLSIMWFGILHALGLYMLLTALLRKLKMPKWGYLAAAAPLIIAGSLFLYFKVPLETNSAVLSVLFYNARLDLAWTDFYPILPGLGWFLLGYFAGLKLYNEKKSLFPKLEGASWIKFMGRHTLFFYIVPSALLTGVFTLLKFLI